MPINTHESYIEIGTGVSGTNLLNTLQLPCPVQLPSSNEYSAEVSINADGATMIEYVGRTQYSTQIKFARLKNTKWWEINRWFEDFGYVFYMKYFSHTDGRVKIHRFYRGNIDKGNPSSTTETRNGYVVPTHYYNCGFSIIDMGEDNVVTISEV